MKKRTATPKVRTTQTAKDVVDNLTPQQHLMFQLIVKATGATPENPQTEEVGRIFKGLNARDEAVLERLYRVLQASLHSTCCGGVGQPECFRTKESEKITAGATTFAEKLAAELDESAMVCTEHHHNVCKHRRP